MAILGAHMSIAGGYYKAAERGATCDCDTIQIFTKNNNQWRAKEITQPEVDAFAGAIKQFKIKHPIAHDSYLINLAAPDDMLWKKSIDSFVDELHRAEMFGLAYLVTHPGAYTTSSEELGLKRVCKALNEVHRQTRRLKVITLLEITAGQGSCLGLTFEHLATIKAGVKDPDRLGVCLDTCHMFAAGYPLAEKKDYQATMRKLDETVGADQVRAIHLNDSKKGLGSRVDRHDHIGRGLLGLEAFRNVLNDRRFARVPMYLETPKEQENGEEMDVVNLRTLRGLINTK